MGRNPKKKNSGEMNMPRCVSKRPMPAGMVGSLDRWKNCPIAWQQSFKGRSKGMSTIVLEAAADYNFWFWHAVLETLPDSTLDRC
jgi:hypothetical protein